MKYIILITLAAIVGCASTTTLEKCYRPEPVSATASVESVRNIMYAWIMSANCEQRNVRQFVKQNVALYQSRRNMITPEQYFNLLGDNLSAEEQILATGFVLKINAFLQAAEAFTGERLEASIINTTLNNKATVTIDGPQLSKFIGTPDCDFALSKIQITCIIANNSTTLINNKF